jgi:thiamine pyrophosphate-dependent acetolactate synthase large subunit-like protein
LPTNVQLAEIERPKQPLRIRQIERKAATATPQSIAAAAAVLTNASRPLIVAGLGAHRAGAAKAIEALAEEIGALLLTTARGKDLFRGNPNNLAPSRIRLRDAWRSRPTVYWCLARALIF